MDWVVILHQKKETIDHIGHNIDDIVHAVIGVIQKHIVNNLIEVATDEVARRDGTKVKNDEPAKGCILKRGLVRVRNKWLLIDQLAVLNLLYLFMETILIFLADAVWNKTLILHGSIWHHEHLLLLVVHIAQHYGGYKL